MAVGALPRRFEQLDGVSVRIFDLDLSTSGSSLDLIPKMDSGSLQRGDGRWQIGYAKHDAVPSAGFLPLPIRHRPRSRRLWPAEEHLRITKRHAGERGKLLVFEREAQMCRVERD